MRKLSCVALLCVLVLTSMSFADIMNIDVTKDSSYRSASGWPTGWYSNYYATIRIARLDNAYFYADLAAIPLQAGESLVINSASLNFRVYTVMDAASSMTLTNTAYRVASDWEEGYAVNDSKNWDLVTQPPVTAEAYGSYTLTDVSSASVIGWRSLDVTNLVQSWADGTYTNYGVMVRQTESSYAIQGVNSRESSYKPYFEVDYSVVPEPASILFMFVTGILGLVRRIRH